MKLFRISCGREWWLWVRGGLGKGLMYRLVIRRNVGGNVSSVMFVW